MSKIEWTDLTQNPIRVASGGHYCEKVSPGCENCYSEAMNKNPWFKGNGQPYRHTKEGPPEMTLDTEMLASWARARKPKKRFICSMTDLFGEWVPDEMVFAILNAMDAAASQTFQILTKRAERMRYLVNYWLTHRKNLIHRKNLPQLPPNTWLGISAEDDRRLDERLPWLIKAQAQTRFLSLEPLLGPIILHSLQDIDWVIIGGESGPNARFMNLEWICNILDQCRAANVPVFIKQLGTVWAKDIGAKHSKGGDWEDWHPDFWIRMWPEDGWTDMPGGEYDPSPSP